MTTELKFIVGITDREYGTGLGVVTFDGTFIYGCRVSTERGDNWAERETAERFATTLADALIRQQEVET